VMASRTAATEQSLLLNECCGRRGIARDINPSFPQCT